MPVSPALLLFSCHLLITKVIPRQCLQPRDPVQSQRPWRRIDKLLVRGQPAIGWQKDGYHQKSIETWGDSCLMHGEGQGFA